MAKWVSGKEAKHAKAKHGASEAKSALGRMDDAVESHKFEEMVYWGIVIASIVGILVIIGFIAFNQASGASSQAFTAIYFEDYNKDVSTGFANFSFTVSNNEGKKTDYIADINIDNQTIKSIPITLEKDQNKTEIVSLPFALDKKTPHKIWIGLRERTENIFYWTTVKKEFEKIIELADFNYNNGSEQATEDWGVPKTEINTARVYIITEPGKTGEYLRATYSIAATPQNDFDFISKPIDLGDSDFSALKITAIGKNIPGTFWIKLDEKDGSVYRYNLKIDNNSTGQIIQLKDFTLASWTKDENNKLDIGQINKIELGFEDPKLTAGQSFTVYFTGLEFAK